MHQKQKFINKDASEMSSNIAIKRAEDPEKTSTSLLNSLERMTKLNKVDSIKVSPSRQVQS